MRYFIGGPSDGQWIEVQPRGKDVALATENVIAFYDRRVIGWSLPGGFRIDVEVYVLKDTDPYDPTPDDIRRRIEPRLLETMQDQVRRRGAK